MSGAEMLSVAAFIEGRHAQAFPSFGSERMGAPVMAFCRIDGRAIRRREPVLEPDALIIQDATLLQQVDVFSGLRPRGFVLINSTRAIAELGIDSLTRGMQHYQVRTLPATEIALRHVGRAVPNVPLLAGFAALTHMIALESIIKAVEDKFPAALAARNVLAARDAFAAASAEGETAHA